jgi:hypothetical protein
MEVLIMDLNKYFEYDRVFEGWSSKDLSTGINLILFLRAKNIQIEQFEDYVNFTRERGAITGEVHKKAFYLRMKIWNEMRKQCPLCEKPMNIFPVNVSKCTRLPDKKIKSTWMCPDSPGCGYQDYNHKPVEHYWDEVAKELKHRYGSFSIEDLVKMDLDLENIGGFAHKNKGCGGKRR